MSVADVEMSETNDTMNKADAKTNEVLMELQNLSKHFVVETNFMGKPVTVLKAVDGVSFSINKGEAFGLVG